MSAASHRLRAGLSVAALLVAAPSLAGVLEAPSRIDSVTVYPDAAAVTRAIEVDLPAGATSLVLRGLPAGLDPASLRVAGEGASAIQIGSVEARLAPPAEARPDAAFEDRLKVLRDERDAVQARLEALEGRKAMVQRYAEASPEKIGPEAAPLPVERWAAAWEAVGGELTRVNEDLRQGRAVLKEVEERIKALEASNRPPDSRARPARDVVVALEAQAAGKARLTLVYRVAGAGWRPVYDAKLTAGEAGKATVEFVRRAEVRQRTGEDWSQVELAVSTARVHRGVRAPELHTERVVFFEPPAPAPRGPLATTMEKARRAEPEAQSYADLPAPMIAAAEQQASLEAGAYEATFRVPGRVDVTGDGAQRALRIGARTFEAELSVRATPALDQTAYLDVAFTNAEEAPLLPGEVALHRDGAFVGRGRIELTPPGDRARLGFGADDRVQITRAPVRRTENEPSWLGTSKQEAREFRTTVKNLHGFPVKVVVVDRLPVSENTAIVVEQLPVTTPPTEKTVEERRGVMAWSFDLAAGATKEIRLGYRINWPADRTVSFETVPNEGERPVPQPRPMR
ncbi:MAG TPA: mucoidy inhibitor MuiA family protein [Beijerinckiaceae bacterium]|jgi:uncharacterized protein (TIGR02231 family)